MRHIMLISTPSPRDPLGVYFARCLCGQLDAPHRTSHDAAVGDHADHLAELGITPAAVAAPA